ncbi:MAG: hypothetical protein K2K56_10210 [Lachnospiraceae bacterium]|nr:hypothetical protein [Lachnospiraceae bacterium]
MGTWGTGIYQNDVSEDVKDDYIAKLKAGKSDEDALQELLHEYKNESEDIDCKCDFFLGLADTLWKKGRLTKEIKVRALELIEEDRLSERWESEKIRKEREKVLNKLEEKLNSQMPERKKVSVHRPYVLGWEEGDVYIFQIKGEKKDTFIKDEHEKYIGWWAVFYVDKIIKEDWQVRGVFDEVAELYLFLTKDKPENAETIQVITPILFYIFNNEKNRYRVKLIERSKRQRPKDLTYLGKCSSFTNPPNEFWQEGTFSWYLCERDILMGYERQLKMQGK